MAVAGDRPPLAPSLLLLQLARPPEDACVLILEPSRLVRALDAPPLRRRDRHQTGLNQMASHRPGSFQPLPVPDLPQPGASSLYRPLLFAPPPEDERQRVFRQVRLFPGRSLPHIERATGLAWLHTADQQWL
jgi:hypothetical protein